MTDFQRELIDLAPAVRAYALIITGKSRLDADDLVQATLEKAWRARNQFEPGTNMKAWLYTILRNTLHNQWRRCRHEVEDPEGELAAQLTCNPSQPWRVELNDALGEVAKLDRESRDALLLITAGLSYEEAARICRCNFRTLQTRVRRARLRMGWALSEEPAAPPMMRREPTPAPRTQDRQRSSSASAWRCAPAHP